MLKRREECDIYRLMSVDITVADRTQSKALSYILAFDQVLSTTDMSQVGVALYPFL